MKSKTRWGLFSTLGFEISACVVGGIWIGWEVDRRVGSEPFGVLGGTLLGTAAAFVRLLSYVRLLKKIDEADDDDGQRG